jgi:hypothetical protein
MAKRLRPLAKTELKLKGGHVLLVRIWKNRTAVALGGGGRRQAYSGLYSSDWIPAKQGRGYWKPTKLSIDLALPKVSPSLWAHELQHFMVDWCSHMGWNALDPPWDEWAAELAERLTKQFWSWVYRTFDKEKK